MRKLKNHTLQRDPNQTQRQYFVKLCANHTNTRFGRLLFRFEVESASQPIPGTENMKSKVSLTECEPFPVVSQSCSAAGGTQLEKGVRNKIGVTQTLYLCLCFHQTSSPNFFRFRIHLISRMFWLREIDKNLQHLIWDRTTKSANHRILN